MIGLKPAFSAYLLCGLFAVLAGLNGTAARYSDGVDLFQDGTGLGCRPRGPPSAHAVQRSLCQSPMRYPSGSDGSSASLRCSTLRRHGHQPVLTVSPCPTVIPMRRTAPTLGFTSNLAFLVDLDSYRLSLSCWPSILPRLLQQRSLFSGTRPETSSELDPRY